MVEGTLNKDGSWTAAQGSPFRSLTADEVADLRAMAEATTPDFVDIEYSEPHPLVEGAVLKVQRHNASWDQQHPLAREVWEKRGLKPKDVK
jgi:hypothetical protein